MARIQNQVTDSAKNELPGDWSPDEKYIIVDYIFFATGGPPIFDLAVVKASNGVVTNLTNTPAITEEHLF
jgi:hypothetical protein